MSKPNRKIRIGIVLASVPSYSETFFTTKINGLTTAGFAVYLFASGRQNAFLQCNWIRPFPEFRTPVARLVLACFFLPFVFVRAPASVMRFWKGERASGSSTLNVIKKLYLNAHILTHSLDWLHFGFAAVAIGREEIAAAIGAKMAVSFRGFDLNVYPLKHPGCYNKLWNRVDQVHSISLYLLEKGFELGLSRDKPYRIITPALNIDSKREIKAEAAFHNPVRILTVARLTWIKGLEYGIKAVGILKSMKIQVHYTIIGDGPEYEKLLYEINDLDLTAEIKLTGKLSHAETLDAMTHSDLYFQPSLNEGFCNSVLEAQVAGCLCIASDAGGLPENILRNETGWLVPVRSPEHLAEAAQLIIGMTPVERSKIIQNAWNRAHREFTIPSHIEKWVSFYS